MNMCMKVFLPLRTSDVENGEEHTHFVYFSGIQIPHCSGRKRLGGGRGLIFMHVFLDLSSCLEKKNRGTFFHITRISMPNFIGF